MDASSPQKTTYYLIDGSGFIFRAYHALPMMYRQTDNMPVNAVFGFCNMIMKLLRELKASHLALMFDAGSESFRNDLFRDYKANRGEAPDELIPQFPLIRDAARAFGLPICEMPGFEADDLIASYAKKLTTSGHDVVIVSSDKDLMQLVNEQISMLDPIKYRHIGTPQVVEKFGVGPDKLLDLMALCGDAVDNVPGVPGIGPKTAAQLLKEYGSLDDLLARAQEIKQPKRRQSLIDYADQARLSRQLIALCDTMDLPVHVAEFRLPKPDYDKLGKFFQEFEFRTLAARIEQDSTPVAELERRERNRLAGYKTIRQRKYLQEFLQKALEKGRLAIDTETSSLKPVEAELIGVSLAVAPGEACYIPLGHVNGDAKPGENKLPDQMDISDLVKELAPILTDPSVLKIGHNLKYDMQVLQKYGLEITPYEDTILMSYILDGMQYRHNLDDTAKRLLGISMNSYEQLCGKGTSQIPFAEVAIVNAANYAAEDADMTLRLYDVLRQRLVNEKVMAPYHRIERPLLPVIAAMESAGMMIDAATLAKLSKEYQKQMKILELKIFEAAGGTAFNLSSPAQLSRILFDELGLPTDNNKKRATNSDILRELAHKGHKIATDILHWRRLSKLKTTYADRLVEEISPQTGRVHTSFSLTATTTGRLSSNSPNLQNIPFRTEDGRKISSSFIARPDHYLISIDYSQIELRVIAHIAQVADMIDAFVQGMDIHAATAAKLYDIPQSQVTGAQRRQAKGVNFSILYGVTSFGLAKRYDMSRQEADILIKNYFARFPELESFMQTTIEQARKTGYVTTIWGRKCFIQGLHSPSAVRRMAAERQAINARGQGSAADIIKMAMARLHQEFQNRNSPAKILLQVHDELIIEAPVDCVEETAELAKHIMGNIVTLSVPLVASYHMAGNWQKSS